MITEGVPGSTVWECPMPGCDWTFVERPPGIAEQPGALAGIFGTGVFAAIAVNARVTRTEEALAAHMGTHEIAEWVAALVHAQDKLAAARKERERILRALRDGISPATILYAEDASAALAAESDVTP